MSSTSNLDSGHGNRKLYILVVVLVTSSLSLAGCERLGRAPEDLDYTPTAHPDELIAQTEVPLDTARLEELQADIEAIQNAVPSSISAGGSQWTLDNSKGFYEPANVTDGVGTKFTIKDQGGGLIELTYIAFDTPEAAENHYERMRDVVRESILRAGNSRNNFPQPNKFNATTSGSVAIMIVNEVYFVEVFVQLFNSVMGNPLVSTAQQALNIFNNALGASGE